MHVCMYNIFLDFKIEMRHMLVTRALWARPLYEPGARSKIRSEDIRRISSALMSFLSFSLQTLSVLISPFSSSKILTNEMVKWIFAGRIFGFHPSMQANCILACWAYDDELLGCHRKWIVCEFWHRLLNVITDFNLVHARLVNFEQKAIGCNICCITNNYEK